MHHNLCTFKVNTDGVLLAAWAQMPNSGYILDIGTGSGVMALIAAQRTEAIVHGIEIDKHSFLQAEYNFSISSFNSRLLAIHQDILNYAPHQKYDSIIINPPFHIDSTISKENTAVAKHITQSRFIDLISRIVDLLTVDGTCSIVIPHRQVEFLRSQIHENQCSILTICMVKSYESTQPFNAMLTFTKKEASAEKTQDLVIYQSEKKYSSEYKNYTSELYTIF